MAAIAGPTGLRSWPRPGHRSRSLGSPSFGFVARSQHSRNRRFLSVWWSEEGRPLAHGARASRLPISPIVAGGGGRLFLGKPAALRRADVLEGGIESILGRLAGRAGWCRSTATRTSMSSTFLRGAIAAGRLIRFIVGTRSAGRGTVLRLAFGGRVVAVLSVAGISCLSGRREDEGSSEPDPCGTEGDWACL